MAIRTTWRIDLRLGNRPRGHRAQSVRWTPYLTHYDYDFGSDIFAGRDVRIVDCGDVAMKPGITQGIAPRPRQW